MSYVLVRHKISDYKKWKAVFDCNIPPRGPNGFKPGQIFRNADDPSELLLLFETDDMNKVRNFFKMHDFHAEVAKAGVLDEPSIFFLEKIADAAV
jgi:hypothetical protein